MAYSEVDRRSVFSDALIQVSLKIDAAIDVLTKYDGTAALLPVAEEIIEKAEILCATMKLKYDRAVNK
jgi:hypothetical protein